MMSSGYLHIDPRVLLDAADGDIAVFRDLCNTFLEIAPSLMHDLEAAILRQERAAAARHSHSLKGTVALVGAGELTSLLQSIETAANSGETPIPDLSGPQALFQSVMREVRQAMQSASTGGLPGAGPEGGA